MKHFDSEAEALAFALPELIATLVDDYERMLGTEKQHYTDNDRATLSAKIKDLRSIEGRVMLGKQYTAFCCQADGLGTLWISTVIAMDSDHAKRVAIEQCCVDWECGPDHVHLYGIADGEVNILHWYDIP